VTVDVLGDARDEYDETFFVNLTNVTNAYLADGQAAGTILDDNALPTLTISDVQLVEGNTGVTYFEFTVRLSAVSEKTVTVNYATADGTATSSGRNADYQAVNGSLTFAAGETTKTIRMAVIGDKQKEANETFFLSLSAASNASLLDGLGLGTILNND
jgi:hypothetical protein